MNKVGIVAHGITPFTKDDEKDRINIVQICKKSF